MTRPTIVSLALLALPAAATAQLPDASIRSLGMGGAYTVQARGYESVFWNPAMLAAHGRPGLSIGLPQAQFDFGSSAWSFGDFRRYSNKALSDADKQYLLDQVDSTLDTRTSGGVAPFSLQIGSFALSLGTAGSGVVAVGRDAVELALFGTAARSGPGEFFTAAGSHATAWAATTLAASFAYPLRIPAGRLSVGATVKRVWGNGLGMGRETASHFQTNPAFDAQAAGHVIYTDYPGGFEAGPGDIFSKEASPGSGLGVDIGGVLELGRLTVGATLVNLIGSMSWDEDRFRYQRIDWTVTQNSDGTVTDTKQETTIDGAAISGDPTAAALRDTVLAHANFSRYVRAGAAMRMAGFRLSADGLLRLSEGLDRVPSQHVSVGAEYVVLGILPLRAGFGTDFADGITLSAGTGLHLGPVKIDIGAATTSGNERNGVRVGAGLGLIF